MEKTKLKRASKTLQHGTLLKTKMRTALKKARSRELQKSFRNLPKNQKVPKNPPKIKKMSGGVAFQKIAKLCKGLPTKKKNGEAF